MSCSWILESLRRLESWARDAIFKHFAKGLPLGPTGYFRRNGQDGASFLHPDDAADRHEMGLDRLMDGTDYRYLEGTWPDTMREFNALFRRFPVDEIRSLLGEGAAIFIAAHPF